MRLRTVVAAVVLSAVAAACGSRLPDRELEAIDAARRGRVAVQQGDLASGDGGTVTDQPATDTPQAAATPGAATPSGQAAAGPARSTGQAAGAAAAATSQACKPGSVTGPGVSSTEIKVASMVTDSGPLPGATNGNYQGTAAYMAMINAQGGVCGRKITVLKGDDGLDPARARSEFRRLEPQVLAFVGNLSVADSGYTDLIGSTRVPYVSSTVDPSGADLETVWPKLDRDVISTGPFLWWKRAHPNISRAAVLFSDVGGVETNVTGSNEAIKRVGFNLVYSDPVDVTKPDYTAEVIKAQRENIQFLYLFAFEVNMQVRIVRNMRQQNYQPEIRGALLAYNNRYTELMGQQGDGWENYLTYLPFLDPAEARTSEALSRFVTWNRRVFPDGQIDFFPVAGWSNADYFVQALSRVGADPTRDKLLQALGSITKVDGGGIQVSSNPVTGLGDTCFIMTEHVDGRWVRTHPAGSGYECGLGEVYRFR